MIHICGLAKNALVLNQPIHTLPPYRAPLGLRLPRGMVGRPLARCASFDPSPELPEPPAEAANWGRTLPPPPPAPGGAPVPPASMAFMLSFVASPPARSDTFPPFPPDPARGGGSLGAALGAAGGLLLERGDAVGDAHHG